MTISETKFNGGSVEVPDDDTAVFLNFALGRLKVMEPNTQDVTVYLPNAQLTPWIVGGVVMTIVNYGAFTLFLNKWNGDSTGIIIPPNQVGGISLGSTSESGGDTWRCNCRDILSATTTPVTTSTTTTTTTTSTTTPREPLTTVMDSFTGTWGFGGGGSFAGSSSEDPRIDPTYTNLPIFKNTDFGKVGPRVPRRRMPAALSVAVIITAINEGADLERTIESLMTCNRVPDEIIVVDDGSIERLDARVALYAGQGPSVVCIRHNMRQGCAVSRDEGSRAAESDLIVFVDSHMDFPADWLDEMLAAHAQYPDAILCPISSDFDADGSTPKINGHWGTGADLSYEDGFGVKAEWAQMEVGLRSTIRVPAVMGACYMMSRQLLRDIGGWSMGLRGWGLDEEFACVRAWLTGHEVRLVASTHVSHRYTRNWDKLSRVDKSGSAESPWVLRWTRQYVNYVLWGGMIGELFPDSNPDTPIARNEMERCWHQVQSDRDFLDNRRTMTDTEFWDLMDLVRSESGIFNQREPSRAVNQ